MAAASQTKPQTEDIYLKKIHKINQCFASCWRLVDWQKDLASRVSSILMELCELEVFLLSCPGQSRDSPLLLGAPKDNIPLAVAEAALDIALEGISCELTGM